MFLDLISVTEKITKQPKEDHEKKPDRRWKTNSQTQMIEQPEASTIRTNSLSLKDK